MKYNLTPEEERFLFPLHLLVDPTYRPANLEPALNFKMNPKTLEKSFRLALLELEDRSIYIHSIYQKISDKVFGNIPNEFFVSLLTEEQEDTKLIISTIAKFREWLDFLIDYNANVVTAELLPKADVSLIGEAGNNS